MNSTNDDVKMEKKKFEPTPAQLRNNVYVSIFYIVIMILFGVPVWFYTTSTYRASLPSADIDKLTRSKININIEIDVIKLYDYVSFTKISSFEEKLFDEIRNKLSYRDTYLQYNYFGYVRPPAKKEIESFLKYSNKSRAKFEDNIEFSNNEALSIILVPYYSEIIPKSKKSLISEWKKRRLLYIRSDDESSLINTIVNTLKKTIASSKNHHKLQQIIQYAKGDGIKKRSSNSVSTNIRLKSQAHYDVTFTLIVPYPTQKSAQEPEWDFSSLKLLIEPIIQQISPFVDLRISSQILYGYRIEKIFPSKSKSDSIVYSTEDLTHIVNRLERFISSNSNMNFVTYLSSEHFQFTDNHSNNKSSTNKIVVNNDTSIELSSFVVPQFGGFVFISKHAKSTHGIMKNHELCSYMMSIFEQHLRKLLGIPPLEDFYDESIELDLERISNESQDGALSSWQLSSWLIEKSVENIASVQMTLASVEDLLKKVPNMVIRDDVADSIARATQLARLANEIPIVFHSINHIQGHSSFSTNHNATLSRSLLNSRDSLKAAEYAFFHPSLLELLYFQDDQKLGVYVPLLIPTLFPLILSLKKIVLFFKGNKGDEETKVKTK